MDLSPLVSQNNRRIEPVVENPMVSFKSSNAFIMFSFKVKKKRISIGKKNYLGQLTVAACPRPVNI